MRSPLRNLFSRMQSIPSTRSAETSSDDLFPAELDAGFRDIFHHVAKQELTMVAAPVLINTLQSAQYVVDNNIDGDFVECGVWRGGNALAAKMVFEVLGSDKKVWLYDTFTGMTAPENIDVTLSSGKPAQTTYEKARQDTHTDWCYASISDVQSNFAQSGVDLSGVKFVQGDVAQTLLDRGNLPDEISVLRLDTDFYSSTRMELTVLYPRLTRRGILILDDYGYWKGARIAADEFFNNGEFEQPFLQVVYTDSCRAGTKTD